MTSSVPHPGPPECASIEPPCNCTSRFAIANPTPSPPCDLSGGLTCMNISNSRGS
jgi:hypothetical protein